MTTTRSNESNTNNAPAHRSASIFRDGLVGGIVAILFAFLPLSPVLGGGIAGYLQAKGTEGGTARAGGLAGGIGYLPHLIVGLYLIVVMKVALPGFPPGYTLVGFLGLGVSYASGLGIIGGLLGSYIRKAHIEACTSLVNLE